MVLVEQGALEHGVSFGFGIADFDGGLGAP
jgi:hypothetical protein